jgi:hypothetical protein
MASPFDISIFACARLKNLNVLSQNLEAVEGSHIEIDNIEKGQNQLDGSSEDIGQERGLLVVDANARSREDGSRKTTFFLEPPFFPFVS